jgi:hypothetical protein
MSYGTQFGTGVVGQVAGQVAKARKGIIALASIAMILGFLVVIGGAIGGARVIHASQATELSLFSGKAATAADKAIIGQVTTCGRETGTIESVTWSGPPLRVTGDKLGTNPSLQVPNASGQSEATCLAAQDLAKGATAQQCPSVALGSGGSLTADARSFTETYVSCMSAVGAS